ncbi:hypothetical protein PHLCEN_2v10928 [Hermanssonia centrifuga]|uniref:Uncharacterized protein n=1 Tax=Hermanssonia centrifuga TaxID=98765 RepID=A0A2R6NLK7_9APHY|nr:hypothetical protein PHLCEN_2v10928 [Hermanssonia centrifuga]
MNAHEDSHAVPNDNTRAKLRQLWDLLGLPNPTKPKGKDLVGIQELSSMYLDDRFDGHTEGCTSHDRSSGISNTRSEHNSDYAFPIPLTENTNDSAISLSSTRAMHLPSPSTSSCTSQNSRESTSISVVNLPAEILGDIFLIYLGMNGDNTKPYSWIQITHVCSWFRQVTLAFPALWTNITVLRFECVEAFLRRAGRSPLCVSVGKSFETRPDKKATLQLLMRRRHRIRELHLSSRWQRYPEFAAFPSPTQPTQVLRLEQLTLRNYPFAWSDGIFRCRLTSLVVEGTSAMARDSSDRPELLNALANLRTLEMLVLKDALPVNMSRWKGTDVKTVALPKLRHLRITDIGLSCLAFLERIKFPLSTAITISITSLHSDVQWCRIIAVLSVKMANAEPILTCVLEECNIAQFKHVRISGWRTLQSPAALDARTVPADLTIILLPSERGHRVVHEMSTLLLSNVQVLSTTPYPFVIEPEASPPFNPIPYLNVMRFVGWEGGAVAAELARGIQEDLTTAIPHLRTLLLTEVTFPQGDENELLDDASFFYSVLKVRRIRGRGVHSIIVERCENVDEAAVHRLTDVVDIISIIPV